MPFQIINENVSMSARRIRSCSSGVVGEAVKSKFWNFSLMSGSPAAATGSAQVATLTSVTLSLGSHGIDYQVYGHASRDASITISVTAGSMILFFTGGKSTDIGTTPTCSAGTFKKLDQVRDYTDYPGYGTAVYVLYNAAGGSTTITQPVTLFDENTCYAVEVLRGKIVRHLTWRQVANASGALTWSSPTATATGPAIAFFDWRGSGSVFSPSSTPFTAAPRASTVIESYLVNNSDGEVQSVLAYREISSAGTVDETWDHTPSQGAQGWTVIVQDEEILPTATATGSAQIATLTAGTVSLPAGSPATATASAQDATTTQAATPDPAAATASAQTAALTGGAVSLATGSPAGATASAVDPTLSAGTVNLASGSPASAAGTANDPTLTPGAASATPAPATATATGVTASLTPGAASVASGSPATSTATAQDSSLISARRSVSTRRPQPPAARLRP